MDIEANIKIVGRDRDCNINCALVDNTGALTVSDNNIGDEFSVGSRSNGSGAYLIFTFENSSIGGSQLYPWTSGLLPNVGSPRSMYVVSDTASVNIKIGCVGIDLQGYEKIFYVQVNGTSNVTTGNTKLNFTGATVNLTTDLTHINRIWHITPISAGSILVRSVIATFTSQLCGLNFFNLDNPLYLCPKNKKCVINGCQYTQGTAVNNTYQYIVFSPNTDGTYSMRNGPFFTVYDRVYTNTNIWGDGGILTISAGEWVILYRTTTASITTSNFKQIYTEYKV